ncbi:hypothetical protein N7501_011712 [Penicillium viridicatum]|nr:hypothetical protein N7501_011712 [Penicillium viridicatum]
MTDTATTPGWYQSNVTTIDPDARSLLEKYSGLQSDEVLSHVLTLAHTATRFLDAGCCVGQELRYLVHRAKIPARSLYGFDLEPGFFDLGYKLFRDDATDFPATLLRPDLGTKDSEWETSPVVDTMRGKIDVVWAGSLLHFWDFGGQVSQSFG